MEFTDEQMAAINEMIANKVTETTADLTGQITALKEQNTSLIGEKRTAAQKAQDAQDEADRARLEKTGDVEAYKERVAALEDRLKEATEATAKRDFEQSLRDAVSQHKVRGDGLTDLFDLLKVRAQSKDGQTVVGVTPISEYLTDYFNTDAGRHWLQPSGSSGSGAPGSTSTSRTPTMTKENFNMTDFLAKPKAERDSIADGINMPHLKNLA